MKALEKLFFRTAMTWKRVLILALLCGVVPGTLMIPKVLEGTSLRQPGIAFEFWILMALIIILNCERPREAGLKTFVFFLISQPIIYLVQVPFSWLHWGLFSYYPRWAVLTVLTLPGAMLAWYVRRGNILSAALLCVAAFLPCVTLPVYVRELWAGFPRMLLAVLFIVGEIILFPRLCLQRRGLRAAVYLVSALFIAFGTLWDTGFFF